MSLENFIPTVWSARLLDNLRKALVYGQPGVVNRDYEGDISQAGDTVRINAIGAVTISDYSKNTDLGTPEALQDAGTLLVINQAKSFNFQIDDVDRAQQKPKVMDAAMREAAYALGDAADQYIAGLWTQVDAANLQGEVGAGVTIGYGAGETNPYIALLQMATDLDEANVPRAGRWAIVPPWFHGYLLMDDRFVGNGAPAADTRLLNGQVGRAAGFDIMISNNVPYAAGPVEYKILAGTSAAMAYVEQINKVEAYRPEKRFADAVKGLHLYGAKVVRPSGLALLIADMGTKA